MYLDICNYFINLFNHQPNIFLNILTDFFSYSNFNLLASAFSYLIYSVYIDIWLTVYNAFCPYPVLTNASPFLYKHLSIINGFWLIWANYL